jgi:hypothetical protein
MMTDQKYLTPQEQLAQEITDALFERKLITENKRSKLPQQIAMGLLDADDWALLVDIATEQDVKENDLVKGSD